MSRQQHFVDRALAGDIDDLYEDLYDEIDYWHEHGGGGVKLNEWLGLTPEEYKLYLEKPESLRVILFARKYEVNLQQAALAANDNSYRLAARGADPNEIREVLEWLRKTQRI